MRLSTEPDRDDERSIAVLHSALDAGVTLLDTADAYCLNDNDIGHNERLIASALRSWKGGRSRIVIATKGGMVRPDGRWEPDGRARHIRAACERSCAALGIDRIPLYQLHLPDPRVPLSTSVKALAALKKDGLIERVGLCNVTVGQIEEAQRITEIDSVQVELSVWNDAALLSGVAAHCIANGRQLLAYRPLGGRRSLAKAKDHPALLSVAAAHGVSPFDIALAWLCDLSELVVPLPGVTRIETAMASARAQQVALSAEEHELLDAAFPSARLIRGGRPPAAPARQDAEVVIIMGLPGAGKTTMTSQFVAEGYRRLNRDDTGGTLRSLAGELDRALRESGTRIVLDNTYVTRKARAEVVQAAAAHGVGVRCVWLATSIDDAQVNAVSRLIDRYGRLPADEELKALRRTDVAAFLPTVQFRYQRELEPPDPAEGFSAIDVVPFERRRPPGHDGRAVIVWCDDVEFDAAFVATLAGYREAGYLILGLSWQPGLADGTRSEEDIRIEFDRINQRAGFAIAIDYCPHAAGPPRCWCRKPLPGLGVLLIKRHRLDPAQCIFVGNGAVDAGYARKLGFAYRTPARLAPI